MSDSHSVTQWIADLKVGDAAAAQKIWERYCIRLVRLGCKYLANRPKRVVDEDDLAQIAFQSFFVAVSNQRFPELNNREDLWKILLVIAKRKWANTLGQARAKKRGGGKVRGESVFKGPGSDGESPGFDELMGSEPTPEFAAQVADECSRMFAILDEDLRPIAQLKLEGFTCAEIAEKLGLAEITIKRKLAMIRKSWEEGLAQ